MTKKITRKAGQVEMIGLILIVIIAGLVIAFTLIYVNAQAQQGTFIHERFGEGIMSSNFVSVISKMYVPECETTYSTIVRDCAIEFTPSGGPPANQGKDMCLLAQPGFRNSCYWAERAAKEVLNNSLRVWGESYRLRIDRENKNSGNSITVLQVNHNNCSPGREKEAPGRQPVPLAYPYTDEAVIVLEVCKS